MRSDHPSLSIRESWETFTESVMHSIFAAAESAGYLLPLLIFPLALIWRWLWQLPTGR